METTSLLNVFDMKLLVVCLLVAAAAAAPPRASQSPAPQKPVLQQSNPTGVQIVQYDNDNIGNGNYKFRYEQNDGTIVGAQGELKNQGQENQSVVVRGSFEWIAPNGVKYVVTYTADENGYRPHYLQDVDILDRNGYVDPAVLARLLAG